MRSHRASALCPLPSALTAVLCLAASVAVSMTIGASDTQELAAPGAREPSWSPDGRRVAVSVYDRIWTMGADGKGGRALTTQPEPASERDPAWSPDGGSIAFAAD